MAGRVIRYVDEGEGPAVVLIHGLGGSWQTWLENIPALARDHRVIALDLPGFGGSEALPPQRTTECFVDVIAELLAGLGITQAVIVGHSLGGLVATMVAEQRPELARGLVLVSAGSIGLGELRLAMIGAGFGLFDALVRRTPLLDLVVNHPRMRWLFLRGAVQRPASLSPDLASEVIPAMKAPGFADAVSSAVEVVRRANPVAVRCPTAMIWGRDDHLVPLATAFTLRSAIPGARLAVLEDVGHCAMFEWPEVVDQILLDFLADVDAGRLGDPRDVGDPAREEPVDWFTRPRTTGLVPTARRLIGLARRRSG
ncbi:MULTISPECIES: alpha/beta fold hydrolase [unclassified Pseudonocardia]|uniref:alpha/beta fold hydrolase n=1 Tax=unclassified Pseudonocardia TaxID=2619320 RepID=UPI00094B408C|nr:MULTISPECIES: alpha/beta fold hydrolase [unclassified Pseudonocardia]